MNTLDIVILILFIPGIIRGMSKGFIEQAISLVGIVLSVYLAFKFSGAACTWLSQYLTVSQTVLNILGFAAVLVLVLLVVMFVAKLITAAVEKASWAGSTRCWDWCSALPFRPWSLASSSLCLTR